MNMNPVELSAYRMIFRNGTTKQVRQALWDIAEVEPTITEELMADIIAMLRSRGMDAVWELAWPIHKLLGKTRSMKLYEAADELGYLIIDRFHIKVCANGKVNLFVRELFYHPDVEPLVMDELFHWVNCLEQKISVKYAEEFSNCPDVGHLSSTLKASEFFPAPLFPIARIIQALEKLVSSQGCASLLAMEYIFRPRLNDYLLIEQKWAREGDGRATPEPDELCLGIFASETTYHLRAVLDILAHIARSGPAMASEQISA